MAFAEFKLGVAIIIALNIITTTTTAFQNAHVLPSRIASNAPVFDATSIHPRTSSFKSVSSRLKPFQAVSYPMQGSTADDDVGLSWENVLNSKPRPGPSHSDITFGDKLQMSSATLLTATSLYCLLTMSAPGAWRYFMAGGLCAAVSHAIPTPVDVVKTRKQVDPLLQNKSILAASREIVKQEGYGALWAGLGPTAVGYLVEGSIKFGVYEVAKPTVAVLLSNLASVTSFTLLSSRLFVYSVCGVLSGVAASLMLCPMEALRIRMVAESDFAPNGMVQGACKMLKREGFSGLSKGMRPMILKQVPYTVTKNVSFDCITRTFYSVAAIQGIALTSTLRFTFPLVAAAIASILSCISSQPGDMLLSLINAREGDLRTRDIFRDIMRSERGVRGFFVGFKTRMLHVGLIVTMQLLIYDYVKRLVGIAATGSM